MFDQRQKDQCVLFITRYLAYLINTAIILAVLGGAAFWIYTLVLAAR